MLLTREQVLDTPPAFLKRRFEGTFIIHPRLGLIHVLRMDGTSFRYKQYKTFSDVLFPEKVAEKVDRLSAFVVERAVPSTLGFFNTPYGVVRLADRAGRQWTWGFTQDRYQVDVDSTRGHLITREVLAYCVFFPVRVFPQQYQYDESVAVGHNLKISRNGDIVNTFRKTVARLVGARFDIISKLLEDEVREEWNDHWNLV